MRFGIHSTRTKMFCVRNLRALSLSFAFSASIVSCGESGTTARTNPSVELEPDASLGEGGSTSTAAGGSPAMSGAAGTEAPDNDAGSEPDATDAAPEDPRPKCNGSPELCARRFDEAVYPTTHNAMSSREAGFLGPNQENGIAKQLTDGIRGLMLDVHDYTGVPHLCHGSCQYGRMPLSTGLDAIATFLREHPSEVVVIIFEMYVSASLIRDAFVAAGLETELHPQAADEAWPTLREMIDAKKRLVVFTDRDGGAYPWYLDVWKHAFETQFSVKTAQELSCDKNRGDAKNRLFILNHFLTDITGSPKYAREININPLFIDRARECQKRWDKLPNFPTVDFYDIGNIFDVTRALNAE